jgi:hypothetical protein
MASEAPFLGPACTPVVTRRHPPYLPIPSRQRHHLEALRLSDRRDDVAIHFAELRGEAARLDGGSAAATAASSAPTATASTAWACGAGLAVQRRHRAGST